MKSYSEWLAYVAVFTVLSAIAGFATLVMYAMCLPRAWVNSLNSAAAVAALCSRFKNHICVCVCS